MPKKTKPKTTLFSRPPIVTVMGHIDHGKTTLLDKIRKTHLQEKETGGITQHLGAYKITFTPHGEKQKPREITFIDTPGHAAFAKMRARGVQVTDIVVLVIDAKEGVKDQTKESLKYIKEAKVPFLIALNKIDLPESNQDKVYSQLAENQILVEQYGGDIVAVPVSAKTGQGIDNLLEMILLLAEINEIKADPQGELEAVILESHLDKNRGPTATVLVKKGTLKEGDFIKVEREIAKIKAMFNETRQRIKSAPPSTPAEVLGFKTLPSIGSRLIYQTSVSSSSSQLTKEGSPSPKKILQEQQGLKIILKADTAGTLEAIVSNFSEEVIIIHQGVGEITESDVLLALSTGSHLIAFNVKTTASAKKLAQTEKVEIKTYKLIYELLEDIQEKILKILEPTIDEEILGEAKILKIFEIKKHKIAGAKTIKGEIKINDNVHLKRDDKLISDSKIVSLRKGTEDIKTAKAGEEFGAAFSPPLDFQENDGIISYNKL
jgi:translation initiation factor IF-2